MIDENEDAAVNEEGLPEIDESEDEEDVTEGPHLNEFGDPIEE